MSQAASSSRPGASPMPRPPGPSNITTVLDTQTGRILCIADIRGRLSHLNTLAKEHDAKAIIHTGDFGFYEISSLPRINDRTLRHLITYSPLFTGPQKPQLTANDTPPSQLRQTLQNSNLELLTEFPKLLAGDIKLQVPVYTVYGACEDFQILEKFRMGIYDVENLHVLDEATTRCIDIGGIKLRLLGLGGALVPHKLFDNGDGQATIAGGQGTMWTTALQIGELVDTAQRVYDETETRMLITHASPGRESILTQLAVITRADLTISGGLHFRYATSYNEFSVQYDMDGFRNKLVKGKDNIEKVWESVKTQVENAVDDQQRILLEKFLSVLERVPPVPGTGPNTNTAEEPFWKNCWNWNLCDAAYGCLVLDINGGRVSADLKSQGFNYAYRRTGVAQTQASNAVTSAAKSSGPSTSATPAPAPPTVTSPVQSAAPKTPVTSEPKSPNSELMSPVTSKDKELQGNGHATSNERAEQRKRDKREKEKEKKERQRADREKEKQHSEKDLNTQSNEAVTKSPTPKESGKATPDPSSSASAEGTNASVKAATNEVEPGSPILSGGESSGAQTPTSRRANRNPWTLFMKLPVPTSEQELRDFFQDAKESITKVNMPPSGFGRGRIAYVEFGDEESMKEGLVKHAEKLKDHVITVTVAENRESRSHNPNYRGRGRGGFAQRNFAAAGLTHRKYSNAGGSTDRKADSKPTNPSPGPAS